MASRPWSEGRIKRLCGNLGICCRQDRNLKTIMSLIHRLLAAEDPFGQK
jgi:hypothetical protein